MSDLSRHLESFRAGRSCAQIGRDLNPSEPVSRHTVSGWFAGRRVPDLSTMAALGRILGMSEHDLLKALELAEADQQRRTQHTHATSRRYGTRTSVPVIPRVAA